MRYTFSFPELSVGLSQGDVEDENEFFTIFLFKKRSICEDY